MNDEMMKALLETLQQLKNGAPDAFNELVRQRSLYCWAEACGSLVAALSCACLARWMWSVASKDQDGEGDTVQVLIAFCILLWIAVLILAVSVATTAIPQAIAPLGKVLGAIR